MAKPFEVAGLTRRQCAQLALTALLIISSAACSVPTTATAPPPITTVPTDAPAPSTATSTELPLPATSPSEPSEAPPASASVAPEADSTFSGDRARQDVDQLALTIGSRLAGSPAQTRASDYLVGQFAAAGFQVDRQPFTFSNYEDRGSTVSLHAAETSSLQVTTLTNSPAGRVQGGLVLVGMARPGDFDPATVSGHIALAKRGEIRFSDKLANVAAAGATALLIYNNQPGSLSGSLVGAGPLPTVGLSQEDGERIAGQLESGPVSAELTVDASTIERQAANVVATRSGGAREVIVGAHYDSVSAGPGANDNGSGTAVLLELARATAGRAYPFTLRLVAFDAEELGLYGSKYYVRQLTPTGQTALQAMINLDMVGVGERMVFGGDSALVAHAIQHASDAGEVGGTLSDGANSSSDHASFQSAGVRAIFVHRARDPRYHTADDRAEYVLPENLASAGKVVLSLLDDLAEETRRGDG